MRSGVPPLRKVSPVAAAVAVSIIEGATCEYRSAVIALGASSAKSAQSEFGSDFPFFTPDETAAGLRAVVDLGRAASLPPVEEDFIEELLERDGLAVLGVD